MSPEQVAEALERLRRNEAPQVIADDLGFSYGAVYKLGAGHRRASERVIRARAESLAPERIAWALKAKRLGKSGAWIAEKLKIGESTLWRALAKAKKEQ